MSNQTLLARPYAKAIFEIAQHSGRQQQWMEILKGLLKILQDPQVRIFVRDKTVPAPVLESFLLAIVSKAFDDFDNKIQNFLKVLMFNKRLEILPEIMKLYEAYDREDKQQLKAEYYSAQALTVLEQRQVQKTLEQFFKKNIDMHYHIDQRLLGGYRVTVGSRVIDASITGYLERLQGVLCE